MQRALRDVPVTLSNQWREDGDPVDPGTVTVDIVRADGTVVVNDGATNGAGTDPRTFTLSAAQNNLLDTLTATWVSSTLGSLVTAIQIVGGFLFSIEDAQADPDLADSTAAEIATARTEAERMLEHACGVAFVPRYTIEPALSGDGHGDLLLRWPKVRSVRSAAVDGTTLTPAQLGAVVNTSIGVYFPDGWARGRSNITVGYEHGFDIPPPGAGRAALRLAKHFLAGDSTGAFSDRVTRAQAGEESFTFAVAGVNGRFGIPEVDAFVQANRMVTSVA